VCHGTEFDVVVPRPSVLREAFTHELHMRAFFLGFWSPADADQRTIHATGFAARPVAHEKRMDLGGFFACSVRSARTRKANAVTATSASRRVSPYTITPGSSGISASHRPSVSCSKTMLRDSVAESGGCGAVAIVRIIGQHQAEVNFRGSNSAATPNPRRPIASQVCVAALRYQQRRQPRPFPAAASCVPAWRRVQCAAIVA